MKAKFVRLTKAIVRVTHHSCGQRMDRNLGPDWIDKGNNTALVCEAYEVVELPLGRGDANGSLISQERMIERHSSVL